MRVALFPLHAVLFPGGLLPLKIFEQRYLSMTKECLRDQAPFGVCLIREGAEVGTPAAHAQVGCLAQIEDWNMPHPGMFHLLARGTRRFRVEIGEAQPDGLIRAEVSLLEDAPPAPVPERYATAQKILQLVQERLGDDALPAPAQFGEAGWVSYRLAEVLPLPLPMRQQVLETGAPEERLEMLARFLKEYADSPE